MVERSIFTILNVSSTIQTWINWQKHWQLKDKYSNRRPVSEHICSMTGGVDEGLHTACLTSFTNTQWLSLEARLVSTACRHTHRERETGLITRPAANFIQQRLAEHDVAFHRASLQVHSRHGLDRGAAAVKPNRSCFGCLCSHLCLCLMAVCLDWKVHLPRTS